MALQRFTHRRPLGPNAKAEAVIRYYQTYRRCHGDSLAEFVAHYGDLWARAHKHGVTAYDGIVRLVYLFPEEWQDWAMATAKLYIRRQYPAYDLTGDIMSFLGAISAGCFKYRNRPPPASEVPSSKESRELPPWALLKRRGREYDEGESSQTPADKRTRTEDEDTDDLKEEDEPREDGSGDRYAEDEEEDPEEEDPEEEDPEEEDLEEEDPEDELEIEESEDDEPAEEEKPQTEPSELAEIEFIPPLPVGPQPEIPPPPLEPFPGDLHQPLHPIDLAFYTELYMRTGHYCRELTDMTHVPVAPEVTPEPPQTVVIPMYPEELLSPIGADTHGCRYGDPVWISSDSDSEEDPMEYEGWVPGL